MAEFDSRERISNLVCSTHPIGGLTERQYQVIFKREDATIDQIEAINWKRPAMNDYCKLPIGFAFNLKSINYDSNNKNYVVTLILRDQYLGDVTRYQAEIATKDETISTMTTEHAAAIAEKDSTITSLNAQLAEADETILAMNTQLEEADEAMLALYEQMSAAEGGDQPAPSDGADDPALTGDETGPVDDTAEPAS